MSRDFSKKRELAQYFIRCYIAARQGLTKLAILRSERNLQGDYAEWLAAGLLGLQLAPSTIQKGFDAKDNEGNTYEIKSRIVRTLRQNTSFDFRRGEMQFDFLIGVFFSPSFDLLGVIRVPNQVVRELAVQNANRFSFRWNKQTTGDPRIEKPIWSEDSKDK